MSKSDITNRAEPDMPTTLLPHDVPEVRTARSSILATKSGTPKHRFTWKEKLRLLDPTAPVDETEARLLAFQRLFAFRFTKTIITRVGQPRQWRALRGRLTLTHVARHLLGDSIPTLAPQWVGARSFPWSTHLVIDVDAVRTPEQRLADEFDVEAMPLDIREWQLARQSPAPSIPSLEERRERVEQALRSLGINPRNRNEVLVQHTPSGGRHYYVFFDAPYLVDQYHQLLIEAGLRHVPGQIEFYPSTTNGLRLPFGHVPGRPRRSQAWTDFVDRYRTGRIRRHSLAQLHANLEANLNAGPILPPPKTTAPTGPARFLGTPKAARPQLDNSTPTPDRTNANAPIQCRDDAERLLATGIREQGTRNHLLKQLAAHLIWFRHQSADAATATLTAWAMDPRNDSTDIQADLANGTDHVAKQIATMCRWYENHQKTSPTQPGTDDNTKSFTPNEVATLRRFLADVPPEELRTQAEFLLHFLWFAKQHGDPTEDGNAWEAAPAVRPVIRRWPDCHHMHYRTRIERAETAGILKLVRDKWQPRNRPGRARTYRLNVRPEPPSPADLNYATALESLTAADTLVPPVEEANESGTRSTPPNRANHADNQEPALDQSHHRAHSPPLRPPRSGVGLGTRPHQRDQEPNAVA